MSNVTGMELTGGDYELSLEFEGFFGLVSNENAENKI